MTPSDKWLAEQEHLLRFSAELNPQQRSALEAQIAGIDFSQLMSLCATKEQMTDWGDLAARAKPPPAVRLDRKHAEFSTQDAVAAGEQALRSGRIGMILVAGGQGTRLGFQRPKGMYPIGPISDRTLFQMHCDRLLAVMQRYDVSIPMYVMTSPATDAETREYFATYDACGLRDDQLKIFCQGCMPAVDAESGRVLLAEKGKIALSPDGHGGLVAALQNNGCLADAKRAGIEQFFYAQVDNPLAQLCDAELIGYHLLANSQMTTQVVKKRFAMEKVGNVVTVDDKVQIIEYSDLPTSAAMQTNPDGSLRLWAGNIAVHIFDRTFLSAVVEQADGLPFHSAHKKVAFVDESGRVVQPEQPNATKFERFIFDLLPMADRALVVEGDAADVFAPVKNADGGDIDTPAHTKAALLAMHRRWLESSGATLLNDVLVEIHPDWALDASDVEAKIKGFPDLKFHADTLLR